jgi:hypothetical protein
VADPARTGSERQSGCGRPIAAFVADDGHVYVDTGAKFVRRYVPQSDADALAEALERLRRYLAPLDDGSHQRLGETCGLDACVICLSEGLIAETLTEFRSKHAKSEEAP